MFIPVTNDFPMKFAFAPTDAWLMENMRAKLDPAIPLFPRFHRLLTLALPRAG